ncbi:carboxylate--amine ligase [Candidatus Woesearchaeota archaeon]|nr:MAG: carboxylate--amine ligase [Candidatus Woesearchaeota archaeon]
MKPWEFWDARIFYAPLAIYILWLMLRHRRGIGCITKADASFPYGGLSIGSKYAILERFKQSPLFDSHFAKSFLVRASWRVNTRVRRASAFINKHLSFPVILKPDYGHRGNGVLLVQNMAELRDTLARMTIDHILQAYHDEPYEFGVFYIRLPGEQRGRIWSITEKVLPTVTGDGVHTLRQLIEAEPRYVHRKEKLFEKNRAALDTILKKGEQRKLLITGSHAQGAIFLEGKQYKTRRLERVIETISRADPAFHFGRYDMKAKSIAAFKRGAFRIVELNGVDSESTNIYDPQYSLIEAYRILFAQWRLLFAIATRISGPYPSLWELITNYRHFFSATKETVAPRAAYQ